MAVTDNQPVIDRLTKEAEALNQSIELKEKAIQDLKQSIKFDKERLKTNQKEVTYYQEQK